MWIFIFNFIQNSITLYSEFPDILTNSVLIWIFSVYGKEKKKIEIFLSKISFTNSAS